MGANAGQYGQQSSAIALGPYAGYTGQGTGAIAIGLSAANNNQKSNSIAIGNSAGCYYQNERGISIGYNTGYTGQGTGAIAIGHRAGETNQAQQSIVINANVTNPWTDTTYQTQSGLFVRPIRTQTTNKVLYYNTTSNEISYDSFLFTNGSVTYPSVAASSYQTTGLFWTSSVPTYGESLGVSVSSKQSVSFASNGLLLYGSTTGNTYSPSLLGYYQEYQMYLNFKFGLGSTGNSINVLCRFIIIGSMVSLTIPEWTSSLQNNTGANNGIRTTNTMPIQFMPYTGSGITTTSNISIVGVPGQSGVINTVNNIIMIYVVGGQLYVNLAPISGGWDPLTTVQMYAANITWSV